MNDNTLGFEYIADGRTLASDNAEGKGYQKWRK
ncbi:hypothetical protein HNQ56_001606 [Anaerotaenia torta]